MNTVSTNYKFLYPGIFLIALATASLELLLPRIWSVTMWYHFAFVAISIAMFGITAGALFVFLRPRLFERDSTLCTLGFVSLIFAISIVLSFLTQLSIPFFPDPTVVGLYSLLLICTVVSTPFVLSGIAITLALTKYPKQIGSIYALDLCGAAIGCISLLWLLNLTDAPTAVIVSALCGSLGAACFAFGSGSQKLKRMTVALSAFLLIFVVGNTALANMQHSMLRPIWVKSGFEPRPLYEKWNSFSRVAVFGNESTPEELQVWGLSPAYPPDRQTRQLHIYMDAYLATIIPHFAHDYKEVDYLKYDLVNIANVLKRNAKVLIVGTGGGKDVLAALTFGAKSVVGVDLNENVLQTVNKRFGDFSGHLDQDPRVTYVNDEARSFIARQKPEFDIIQISAIDSGMATGAGAFALTENSLYTVEAWQTFLQRLTPRGILSCSRWYDPKMPAEIYRLGALARTALYAVGITDPRRCIVIMNRKVESNGWPTCATALISRSPFSQEDLEALKKLAGDLQFDLLITPDSAQDQTLEQIVDGKNLHELDARLAVRTDPPTDDSPYFFYVLKPMEALLHHISIVGENEIYDRAEIILLEFTVVIVFLTALAIISPLFFTRGRPGYGKALPLLSFFACIGFGYMLVEVSQLQRLIVFLGHPSYSLSVVLFTLLISSGIGSFATTKIVTTDGVPASDLPSLASGHDSVKQEILVRIALVFLSSIVLILLAYGLLTPLMLARFVEASTPIRICTAAAILFPIGFLMGTAMPLGLKIASFTDASLIPWFWGVNGATSVCASVLTVAIAVVWGISTAFWLGSFFYLAALASLWLATCKDAGALPG